MSKRLGALVGCVFVGVVGFSRPARADGVSVVVDGYASWSATVADLQRRTDSEGTCVTVTVTGDDARPLACDRYHLSFDSAGTNAFAVEVCNPDTQSTRVCLQNRSALFDHGGIAPMPIAVALSADVRMDLVANPASAPVTSSATCAIAITPTVVDLEHGTRVPLSPSEYELVVARTDLTTSPTDAGWLLSAANNGDLEINYRIVRRSDGQTVANETATLQCGVDATANPVDPTVTELRPLASAGSETTRPPIARRVVGGTLIAFAAASLVAATVLPIVDANNVHDDWVAGEVITADSIGPLLLAGILCAAAPAQARPRATPTVSFLEHGPGAAAGVRVMF